MDLSRIRPPNQAANEVEIHLIAHLLYSNHSIREMLRTSSALPPSPGSLEACTSMDPADYKWGSIPPHQQALMNAHFMQMSFFAAFPFPGLMMPYPGCAPAPWMKPMPMMAPVPPGRCPE